MPSHPTDNKPLTPEEIWPKGQQAGDVAELLSFEEEILKAMVADPNTNTKSLRDDFLKVLAPDIKQPSNQFSEELVIKSMADVQELPVLWLWLNKIPRSAITLFTGNPDTGKTLAYCDIAARVSSFTSFPDIPRKGIEPIHIFGGHVIMLASEDDYARVIKPRLMAAGANLSNIAYIDRIEIQQGADRQERMFAFDQDMARLDEAIRKRRDSLVIVDPISSYFGRGSMHKAQDIRHVFSPLTMMCEKHGVSIIAVEHSSKRTDVAAIHKLSGGVAMTAAARAVFVFAHVPEEEGQHVMHFVKGNLSKSKEGIRYTIEDKMLPTLPDAVPFIKWGAADKGTADEILSAQKGTDKDNRAARAVKFLKEYLTEDRLSVDVEAEGAKRGLLHNALAEGKKQLGFKAIKRGSTWWWPALTSDKSTDSPSSDFGKDEVY